MAIEQEFRVECQSFADYGRDSEESVRWIDGNVLVETPRSAFQATKMEADDLVSELNAEVIRALKVHGVVEGPHQKVRSQPTSSEQSHSWKMAARNLPVIAPLLLSDLMVIVAILATASHLAGHSLGASGLPSFTVMVSVLLALLVGRHAEGLYPGVGLNVVIELRKQTIATTVVFVVLSLSWLAIGHLNAAFAFYLLIAYGACVMTLPISRCLTQVLLGKTSWWGFPVLLFGCGQAARRVLIAMRNSPSRGLRPIGCVGLPSEIFREHQRNSEPVPFDDYLGSFEDAPALIARHKVQWVIGAMPESPPQEVARLVSLYASGAPHRLVTTGISDFPYLWQIVRDCGGQAGIEIRDGLLMPPQQVFKRIFDSCAVFLGGLLISPLLIGIALAIKLGSPGPVFYGQRRIGYAGKEIMMWKFRTMYVNADAVLRDYLDNDPELRKEWEQTHKLQNDPRITRIGRFLRATSLDELPQLWNVLRGEMSLVGPRPIVDHENYDREYVTDYPEAYQLYVRVRPGITGLWQVAGRRDRNYYLRPQLDAYYVRNWSIWLDLFLLTRTVKTVVRREGAC